MVSSLIEHTDSNFIFSNKMEGSEAGLILPFLRAQLSAHFC